MAIKSLPLAIAGCRALLAPFVRQVTGLERIPLRGPLLVAANHGSLLDGILLASRLSWARYGAVHMIAYEEPFRHWLFGWVLRSGRCIPFARGSRESRIGMMRTALGHLARGEVVGIFPEGHLNLRGERLGKARPGAALLALESGAPVLPVGIRGSRDVLPPGSRRIRWQRAIRIEAGEPMRFGDLRARYHGRTAAERAAVVREVSGRIMAAIADLSGLAPPRRNRGNAHGERDASLGCQGGE